MRILVEDAHVPLLASNGIAILCCSVVNFVFANHRAFAERAKAMDGGTVGE